MSNIRRSTPDKEITEVKNHQAISMSSQHLELPGQNIHKFCELENSPCCNGNDSLIQILTKEISETSVPHVFTVSDASSSSHINLNTDNSNACNNLEFGDSSGRLTSSGQGSSYSPSTAQSSVYSEKNHLVDPSIKTPFLIFQTQSLSQPQHTTSKLGPPVSPKPRTRSETCVESAGRNSGHMLSPASPSRKYFKVVSSPILSAEKRRGSEPVFNGTPSDSIQCVQVAGTDRKWEKLRSILVAMRNEPFDVEQSLNSTSPELSVNIKKEQFAPQSELSHLQDVLKQKEFELQQAEAERDSALAYIRHLKANFADKGNKSVHLYEKGIEGLKAANVSKESVIEMLSPLMKELHEQKSYLDCLMTVVLMRAPWMLDEVDKMELPNDQSFSTHCDDEVVDDFKSEGSGCEVWC